MRPPGLLSVKVPVRDASLFFLKDAAVWLLFTNFAPTIIIITHNESNQYKEGTRCHRAL